MRKTFHFSVARLAVALTVVVGCGITSGRPEANPWIVFQSERDGNWEIYKMTIDGEQVTRLTNSPSEDRSPWWSADGLRIRFRSDRSGEPSYYSMDLDGQNVRPFTPTGSYSPSRQRKAAVIGSGGPESLPLLELTAPSGSKTLAPPDSSRILSFADWSPDETSLLFLAGQDFGSLRIWVSHKPFDVAQLFSGSSGTHNSAEFSPDGQSVLFNSNREGPMSTYVANRSGEEAMRLLPDRISAHASWVSDTLIVLDVEASPGVFDVHVVGADGVIRQRLTKDGTGGWPSVQPIRKPPAIP